MFLISVVLSLGVGIAAFSRDNIENRLSGYRSSSVGAEGYKLVGWQSEDGTLVSGDSSGIVITGLNTFVNNIRLDCDIDGEVGEVTVLFSTSAGQTLSPDSATVCKFEQRNDDFYILVEREVADIRIDVYQSAGRAFSLRSVEINPTKLNVNTIMLIFSFIFPLIIGYSIVEMVYDKDSLKKDILAMKRYRYLLGDLVSKDIKTKYRRSLLGVLWSVLNPLLMMAVLTTVFSNIIRVEVEGGFAMFYLIGYVAFNFISEATSFSLYTITSAAPLIKKVYIPKYIFPLEKCIFSLINFMFSLIAFVIVFVIFCITGQVTPHLTLLMFPIPIIYLFVFCLGLCLALSALLVFFRDIGHIWGILLTVWMYASPIIYPIDILPPWLVNILSLNPLTHYIDYFRNVMIYGRVPSLEENLLCILFSVSSLLLGVVIFRKKQDKFLLHI